MADPANAVEAAALLVEAVDAGKAVEAMRIVFSATAGWRRKQLAKQLQSQKPQQSSGSEEIARLQGEVEKLQEEVAAKDAAMEKTLRDHERLEEGRALAYEQLLSEMEVPSSMNGSDAMMQKKKLRVLATHEDSPERTAPEPPLPRQRHRAVGRPTERMGQCPRESVASTAR